MKWQNDYRPDIDGLRAIAVLLVVVFHAFPAILRGGFIGVDVFFVISGYLIYRIIYSDLSSNRFGFLEFYSSRARRILPALLIVLSAVYLIGWFVLLPQEFSQLGKHIAASSGFVQNFNLWREDNYFDISSELKPLLHLWSLSIEGQFYVFIPAFLFLLHRLNIRPDISIAVLIILSFAQNVATFESAPIRTFFFPSTRAWELLSGALVGTLSLRSPVGMPLSMSAKNLLSILGLTLIISSSVILYGGDYPGWSALFPVLGACMVIGAGSRAWINREVLGNPLLVFVGLISYPIYLWHWSLLSLARIVESETPSHSVRGWLLALSFLLATGTYLLIERPLRRSAMRRSTLTYLLCAGLFAIGLLGSLRLNNTTAETTQRRTELSALEWGHEHLRNELCTASHHDLEFEGGYCVRSNSKPPATILLGDSHSNSWYPGLKELTVDSPNSILNIAGPGCLPFLNTSSARLGDHDKCAVQMNSLLDYAAKQATVSTVIMSSRGPLYLFGRGYRDPQRFSISLTNRPDLADPEKIFELAMRQTLTYLQANRKSVVFVIDVPEIGFDPRTCIDLRPFRLTTRTRDPCALPRKEFDDRNLAYRNLVLRVLNDYPEVKVFDPSAILCDQEWCSVTRGGAILYRDSDHLSVAGSRALGKLLIEQVKLNVSR